MTLRRGAAVPALFAILAAGVDPSLADESIPAHATNEQVALRREAPPSADEVRKGAALFTQMCARCHGLNMVAASNGVFDLRKFPPHERDRFFNSVTKGKNEMPAWGDLLKPEEITSIWAYVRSGG